VEAKVLINIDAAVDRLRRLVISHQSQLEATNEGQNLMLRTMAFITSAEENRSLLVIESNIATPPPSITASSNANSSAPSSPPVSPTPGGGKTKKPIPMAPLPPNVPSTLVWPTSPSTATTAGVSSVGTAAAVFVNGVTTKPFLQWSINDVSQWLGILNLSQHAVTFARYAVDGKLLATINEDYLTNELAVSSNLQRKKILNKVEELKASSPHVASPSSSSALSPKSPTTTTTASLVTTHANDDLPPPPPPDFDDVPPPPPPSDNEVSSSTAPKSERKRFVDVGTATKSPTSSTKSTTPKTTTTTTRHVGPIALQIHTARHHHKELPPLPTTAEATVIHSRASIIEQKAEAARLARESGETIPVIAHVSISKANGEKKKAKRVPLPLSTGLTVEEKKQCRALPFANDMQKKRIDNLQSGLRSHKACVLYLIISSICLLKCLTYVMCCHLSLVAHLRCIREPKSLQAWNVLLQAFDRMFMSDDYHSSVISHS
jgi:hypothetical protein